jgi:hypothetical protein
LRPLSPLRRVLADVIYRNFPMLDAKHREMLAERLMAARSGFV